MKQQALPATIKPSTMAIAFCSSQEASWASWPSSSIFASLSWTAENHHMKGMRHVKLSLSPGPSPSAVLCLLDRSRKASWSWLHLGQSVTLCMMSLRSADLLHSLGSPKISKQNNKDDRSQTQKHAKTRGMVWHDWMTSKMAAKLSVLWIFYVQREPLGPNWGI